MRNRKRVPLLKMTAAILGVCALMVCSLGAVAQEATPRAARPAPEKNPAAWEAEAKTVGQDLGLTAEQLPKLVEAYKAARESQMAAVQAKMEELRQGGGQPDFRAYGEVNQAEKAKLEAALKGFLNPEQTAKALASLGTFNRRWDSMIDALNGMGLEEKAKADAMKLVAGYIAESGAIMQATTGGDFEAARAKIAPLREKLDTDLAKILSADQMTKWKEANAAMRRGPGRPSGQPAAGQAAPAPAAKPAGQGAPAPATAPEPAAK